MAITATILADSISPAKHRLTTFELCYPREILHEEFLTHRRLSRNASSSRARPVNVLLEEVRRDAAMPIRWGISGSGMSDHGEMESADSEIAKRLWLEARDRAVEVVGKMMRSKVKPHKQIVNLLLRPFEHITVVVSATDWTNFYALRTDEGAKPEFQFLANAMWEAQQKSEPTLLQPGEWHLPYLRQHELEAIRHGLATEDSAGHLQQAIQVSVARCARVSYKNHRGKLSTFGEDLDLYQKLVGGAIKHPSPAEHQATPDVLRKFIDPAGNKLRRAWDHPELHGNLVGFIQHRKQIPGEHIAHYQPQSPTQHSSDNEHMNGLVSRPQPPAQHSSNKETT